MTRRSADDAAYVSVYRSRPRIVYPSMRAAADAVGQTPSRLYHALAAGGGAARVGGVALTLRPPPWARPRRVGPVTPRAAAGRRHDGCEVWDGPPGRGWRPAEQRYAERRTA